MSKDEIIDTLEHMKAYINKLQSENPSLMDNTHVMAIWDNLSFLESDIEKIYRKKEQEEKS
jgi:hypothetical protein